MKAIDPHGTLHPDYKPSETRFKILVRGVREEDCPPELRYELLFIDRKYQDSDGYPIDSICAGASWEEAFKLASSWVDQALSTDRCIF